MNSPVIRTRGLTKRYGKYVAVDGLDLEVHEAEVFGLLGPNGAGKTTTILMLLGLTDPTSGEISVLGLDPRLQPISVKRQVGYLPDSVGFYDDLTARENLRYTARLNGNHAPASETQIERALARMGLADVIDRRVATFSRGMRQRLGLAEIALRAPRVAILDEPTVGLDPTGAREFLDMVLALKHEGMSVLLSSHHLHQVQAICDRVGLFSRGRLVLHGTVDELAARVLGASWRVRLEARGERLQDALQALPGVSRAARECEDRWLVESARDIRPELVRAALGAGAEVYGIQMERPGLDEVYASYFQSLSQGVPA